MLKLKYNNAFIYKGIYLFRDRKEKEQFYTFVLIDCILSDATCTEATTTEENVGSSVVEFKDSSSFLGTRDSVLGVIFGSVGFAIIVVASFYLILRFRRRRRWERIRRYLGYA